VNRQWSYRSLLLGISLAFVGCGGQLGGIQPPSGTPFIIASIEPSSPHGDFKVLHISGGPFQANEQVTLTIVAKPDNSPAQTLTQLVGANAAGHVDHAYSGSGGGVCNPPSSIVHIRYSVTATGGASHKVSNVAGAGC
jgi:hypothetical protein